ncbi:MAG: hypothetical protein HY302_09280 [Opitutae bacterium]|nr:hypothetical protein [Opitutae bacterium]
MTTPFDRISAFILEHSAELPLSKRAGLYRDMADLTTDEARADTLTALADDLAAIEQRHDQLVLDFKRRAEG